MKKILFIFLSLLAIQGSLKAQNCLAAFSYSSSPTNVLLHSFTNNSSTGIVIFDSISYSWSFGDGSSSFQTNPVHQYNAPGTYFVCLQMNVISQGSNVCFDSICSSVTISFAPSCSPNFLWSSSAVNPNNILFQDLSSVQNIGPGDSIRKSWSFGDGTSTQSAPNGSFAHLYSNSGNYLACLTISIIDSNGSISCTNTYCDTIIINSIPVSCGADFNWRSDSLNGHLVNFYDSSSFSQSGAGLGDSIVWDFGDGTNGFGDTVNHQYALSGNYTVCQVLYVISQGSILCIDSICKTVRVQGSIDFCEIEYLIDSVNSYAGVVYVWNLGDSLNQNTSNSYFWDFGDGNSSNQSYPSHQYASNGSYLLCLSIISINSFGDTCIATYCDSLKVNPNGTLGKLNSGFVLNILNPLSIGIQEFQSLKMDVYPNPANDRVHLVTNAEENENLEWKIYNITGGLVLSGTIDSNFGRVEEINVSSLKNGIYLISINSKSSVFNSKLKIRRW